MVQIECRRYFVGGVVDSTQALGLDGTFRLGYDLVIDDWPPKGLLLHEVYPMRRCSILPLLIGLAMPMVLVDAALVHAAPPSGQQTTKEKRELLELNGLIYEQNQTAWLQEKLKDHEQAKKLLAVAVAMLKESDKEPPFNYSAAGTLAVLAGELHDHDAGNLFFKLCVDHAKQLQSDRKLVISYLNWIDHNIQGKHYNAAEKLCKELMELEANSDPAQARFLLLGRAYAVRKSVQIQCLRGDAEGALAKLDQSGFNKDSPFILETRAWVLQYLHKYDEAADIYERILKLIPEDEDNRREREKFSRILGSLYGDMGKVDKATELLMALLKQNPEDAGLNNDLGYIWADNDQRLDEAEKMIRKAVEAEPNNASYLDSLAWVLFKKKQYEDAKKYMMQATGLPRGQSSEILDHLGDIHWALGEKRDAVSAWKRAMEQATGSGRDLKRKAEIEKKLKDAGEADTTGKADG